MSARDVRGPDAIDEARVRLFRNRVCQWAGANGRRLPWRQPGQSLYQLIVTEVLLQQTRAETVSRVYDDFFGAYPDWNSLASADLAELQDMLRPVGIWRRRSTRLVELAQRVLELGGALPTERDDLEKLPAVGQYVASAALLFQGVSREPLLDSGMARVLERFFGPRVLADIRHDAYLQKLAREVVDCDKPIEANWSILDLAALVCRVREPRCFDCTLREMCRHGRLSLIHI